MNIYQKLNLARKKFHSLKLEKTGLNKFAGYKYFELGDFLIPALSIFDEVGLCAFISFNKETATMRICETNADAFIEITSPMGSAQLKGCHEVQNIGAVETWQPIETAPKDTKARLVWVPENRCIFCVSWTEGLAGYEPPGWLIFGGGYRSYLRDGRATHWMPLPAPPTMVKS